MGCYGIGVGRNLACVVEENSDEKGICMPFSIAPFKVHITPLRLDDEQVNNVAFELYSKLEQNKIPTLIDDRECGAGVKFADADLMGMPIRVVISPRSLSQNQAEIKLRKTGETYLVDKDEIYQKILEILNENLQN